MNEQVLTGWLCMIRLNFEGERSPFVPTRVQEALTARGWLDVESEAGWDGEHNSSITDAGYAITDLNGAEWGIDTIPELSQ